MKKLSILAALLGLLIATPAVAGECLFKGVRVVTVIDGRNHGKEDAFLVHLSNRTMWAVAPENVRIARAGAGGGIKEGHFAKVCRSWGSLHMASQNSGDSFVVVDVSSALP